ncbi:MULTISPECIES: LysR family transcriptional regulator [unclassified Streptomyces]|uniref:LysR family transcriptional regulator n=1 Tax=unclassified Streptomyces TaxID=2593676 RepID=UPI001F03FC29|nr:MULTISPECIES: LysR substrate-binding domain-containing protein [unclassified Streptomyces]MCH0566252.1 LysR family transcriptional regulator [Streptomyces sp. MUM 2J]MCH0568419.1 LysR family transcriptional regulator [Streptomyces sp. MUM 136J]
MDLRLLRYFVAVAEERHFGRAAARLHMTQPPLTRAIQRLEADLGAPLLVRSASGVTLTAAGSTLYDEARTLLAQADHARARVTAAAKVASLTIGTLGDSIERTHVGAGTSLATAFRRHHPGVKVRVLEADLGDPTGGLRAGLVDVAVTRAPFDDTGITSRAIRSEPVGVVLRTDDPLAERELLYLADLDDRTWFQFPDGTDPLWRAYWNGVKPGEPLREGPVVRTVHECVRAVLWNGTLGLAPLGHELASLGHETPDGLTVVPLADMPPSPVIVAWRAGDANPLVHSFVELASPATRRPRSTR